MRGERGFKGKIPDDFQLVFIAHFLNFSKKEIYEMNFDEITYWYDRAFELYKIMNTPKDLQDSVKT